MSTAIVVGLMTAKRLKNTAGSAGSAPAPIRRRWRDYKTPSGRSPVEEFIEDLSDSDAAAVLVGMEEVRERGLRAGRHLDGDIWEVRAAGDRLTYRILFAREGSRGQVLLALEGVQQEDPEDAYLRHQAGEDTVGRLAAAWRGEAKGTGQAC